MGLNPHSSPVSGGGGGGVGGDTEIKILSGFHILQMLILNDVPQLTPPSPGLMKLALPLTVEVGLESSRIVAQGGGGVLTAPWLPQQTFSVPSRSHAFTFLFAFTSS